MPQIFLDRDKMEQQLFQILDRLKLQRLMLVTGDYFEALPVSRGIQKAADRLGLEVMPFRGYSSNPRYEEILSGVRCFEKYGCQGILAVGGGSCIDTGKCIKAFSMRNKDGSDMFFMAVPTTAGTGSESTQFAVIYKDGEKWSVDDQGLLPGYVLLDGRNLETLPVEGKRAALCDALSHGIESFWSLKATDQSKEKAQKAIKMILEHMDAYWENDPLACEKVLEASNLAGQAINMTRTTAAHAMCYKFTSLFGVPHGYAVMLCLPEVWEYLMEHLEDCRDERGVQYLSDTLRDLSGCLGRETSREAVLFLKDLRKRLKFFCPRGITEDQLELMTDSVNIQRLDNFPIALRQDQLRKLYEQIIRGEE